MSGPFKMKNPALNYSAKNRTPINYGSSTTHTSPAKQNDEWVYDDEGNKKYKKGSMRDRDAKVIEKAADKTKVGGKGTTSAKEQEAHNLAVSRTQQQEIEKMSKKELLEASGKKTNILNRLTTSKKKLKKGLKTEQGRIQSEKGTDIGQQVLGKGDVENVDEYSGVAPTAYASPAKDKRTKTVEVEHTHEKKDVSKHVGPITPDSAKKARSYGGNIGM